MAITQEVLEQSCLGLISYSGAAKSDYLEAVDQLAMAEMARIMAEELIEVYKRIN